MNKTIIDTFVAPSTFMFNNVNNSLKILAGKDYSDKEWFTYNDGKQTLQCKVDVDNASFKWASIN